MDQAEGIWPFAERFHRLSGGLGNALERLAEFDWHRLYQLLARMIEHAPAKLRVPIPDRALEPGGRLPAGGKVVQLGDHLPQRRKMLRAQPFSKSPAIQPAHQRNNPPLGDFRGDDFRQ